MTSLTNTQELSLNELDQVNGGIAPMAAFGVVMGLAVGGAAAYGASKALGAVADAVSEATGGDSTDEVKK